MDEIGKVASQDVTEALKRVSKALEAQQEYLTELDQAIGDGDLGVTASKIAVSLKEFVADTPVEDLGKYLVSAGMAINRAAPSTMGTLLATGLIRTGKEVRGLCEVSAQNLVIMLEAADQGIQERGKAKVGDKTIIDALHPAAEALKKATDEGVSLKEAGEKMLVAAERGLKAVTPLQSHIGRAGWVGERTIGQVDPGCALLVVILKAILG